MAINYEYLGRKILGGGVDENNFRTCMYEEYFRLETINDLTTFVGYLPSVGRLVQRRPAFRIKSCQLDRISEPRGDGKVDLTVKFRCSTRFEEDETDQRGNEVSEETPPWMYRIEDFQIDTATEKETATTIWPAGSMQCTCFCNSAGIPYDATVSRGLARISFAYNLESINPDSVWAYVYKINMYPVVIAGLNFAARSVLINKINLKKKYEYFRDGSIQWTYYKINVELLADPYGFDKPFPNLSNYIITNNGSIAKIWTWNAGCSFGTLADYFLSGYTDGEEIDQPMYITENGRSISSFFNGIQIPVYRYGSLFEPIDFNYLSFPEVD